MQIHNLAQWLYQNTSFTSDQAREFVDGLTGEQQAIAIAALESAFEAGVEEGKKE
ncbi:hypothetical protein M8A51_25690 [Schlegelella sp. S2-27]|uniref:Uncharacterized protein n=1 Tax=Caldimonas mangrovi TaxID=2944811 RepID=A0ABT0YW01_9BURK|nr:hypothetical protein [Caldimonas mangrovi]MCM5682930.1 hypothetical protein [Caldimonas mangrovi]